MKTIIIILTLIQVLSTQSRACDYNNEAIRRVILLADEVESLLGDDSRYESISSDYKPKIQKIKASRAMKPINPTNQDGQIEYNTVGNVVISSSNGGQLRIGSGFKIGKSCVITSAHVLFESLDVSVNDRDYNEFNGKIKFERGGNSGLGSVNAKVFFKMTNEKEDFELKTLNGNKQVRAFKGHNDLVILKLEKADDNFKKIAVRDPKSFSSINPNIGEKISCQGSPSHAVDKTYGNCSGAEFLWEQKNARIFDNHQKYGLSTNLASSAGMSGGSCLLNNKPEEVFAVVSSGFSEAINGKYIMPNLKFSEGNIENGAARYLSLFHILDKRMKKELGYGLDKIADNCN